MAPPVSEETVHEIEILLDEARSGKVTGFAYVAIHTGADFSVNCTGRARFLPVYTLGALHSLHKFIESLIP